MALWIKTDWSVVIIGIPPLRQAPWLAGRRRIGELTATRGRRLELEMNSDPEIPADFAAALEANPAEKARFDKLPPSHKRQHVLAVESAKAPETRARRIEGALKILRDR
jgi:uncharacterized protein YdeI (YjbR/CyaY-like superfamily)